MPISDFNIYFRIAQAYVDLGYSVIPLLESSKQAAVAWSEFQSRAPRTRDLNNWFNIKQFTGIAIITGNVSGLVVLDFDDISIFDQFREQHPDLVNTFTVKTRRGVHLYYTLPEGVSLSSRKASGVDLQANGKYVVAPPTIIDGHQYMPCRITEPLLLDPIAQKRILTFLDSIAAPINTPLSAIQHDPSMMTAHNLTEHYHQLVPMIGRNNALFQTACLARDHGHAHHDTLHMLASVHAGQQKHDHHLETYHQRLREAQRTIQSAYSRPPRPLIQKERSFEPTSRLSNQVREHMLAQKQTAILRTIEGLYLLGIAPGVQLTYKQMLSILRGHIGKHSIEKTLQSGLFTSSPTPPSPACTASDLPTTQSNNAYIDTEQKPGRIQSGRPPMYFTVPTPNEICERLNVQNRFGDPLTLDDIQSAKRYRQALHRKHIERRPGQYSRKLLAMRLGKCVQTIRNYDRECGVQVLPMYTQVSLTWNNLKRYVPQNFEHVSPGMFLQDDMGKRFPLKYPLACKLLKQKRTVYVMQREVNYYCIHKNQCPVAPFKVIDSTPPGLNEAAITRYWQQSVPAIPDQLPTYIMVGVRQLPPQPTARYSETPPRQPVYDPDRINQWVEIAYAHINALVRSADKRISRSTTQQLLTTYGIEAVKRALWIMDQRGNIENPAGFLIVLLRSNHTSGSTSHSQSS